MQITINGFKMNYEDEGRGAPVVLIHGFPFRLELWEKQREFLVAQGYRVITPDLRGFGRSEYRKLESMGDYSDDIVALLDHLKIERAVIGGMSMGGYILFNLAERYPERLSAAIWMVTRAAADSPEGKAKRTELAERTLAGETTIVPDTFIPLLFAQSSYESRPELVELVRGWGERTDPRTIADALIAMRDRIDYSTILDRFKLPAMVVAGELDRTIPPDNSEAIARGVSGARYEVIAGGGHMANLENPADLNRVLLDFLKTVPIKDS